MKTIVRNVFYNNKNVDILIENKKILDIGNNLIINADKVIDGKGGYIHSGLVNSYFNGNLCDAKKLLLQGVTAVFDFTNDIEITKFLISSGIKVFKAIGDFDGTVVVDEDYLNNEVKKYKELGVQDVILYLPSPNISQEDEYATIVMYAKKYHNLIATSVSENLDDVGQIDKEYGCSPVELLESYGFLDYKNLLIDCVYMDKEDVNILTNYDTTICTCPTKNLKSGSGIAPVYSFLKNGVNLILGGVSNNILNETSLVKDLQSGILNEANILKDEDVLPLINKNVRKIYPSIGEIKIGEFADFILTDERDLLSCTPLNINIVFIDGEIKYKK